MYQEKRVFRNLVYLQTFIDDDIKTSEHHSYKDGNSHVNETENKGEAMGY